MQPSLMDQGITLMLVGMGTVFVFLTLLVLAISVMATLLRQLAPAPAAGDATDEEVAAISAAIALHRTKNNS